MKHPRKHIGTPDGSTTNPTGRGFETIEKSALADLADRLLLHESAAIETCVDFIEAETKGIWHGRARAKMCRRLKHCKLTPSQRARLFSCITGRLRSGHFSEQFRDQLHLALHIDAKRALDIASTCVHAHRDYIRRHAEWLLNIYALKPPSPG